MSRSAPSVLISGEGTLNLKWFIVWLYSAVLLQVAYGPEFQQDAVAPRLSASEGKRSTLHTQRPFLVNHSAEGHRTSAEQLAATRDDSGTWLDVNAAAWTIAHRSSVSCTAFQDADDQVWTLWLLIAPLLLFNASVANGGQGLQFYKLERGKKKAKRDSCTSHRRVEAMRPMAKPSWRPQNGPIAWQGLR